MKNLILIAILLLTAGTTHSQTCSELFFSEYSEGSSNNKYFEVYNPTAAAISLSGYTIYLSGNGGSYTNSFTSNAVIASGDVYVVSTNQSSSTILAESDTAIGYPSVAHYNGDDALILVEGTDTIDVVGVPGVDPGSSWAVGTGSTANHTLVRKATITGGSTNWTTGASEWDVYAQNTWSYVGSHTSNCSASGPTNSWPNIVTVNSFNGMNQNGVVDSLGVYKWIKGIVTSIDFDGNSGYVFYMEDSTDGINIYSPTDLNNYTSPLMGDSLLVYGQVGQFQGLTQLVIDSLILINQNNTLPIPSIETILDESTESELIKLSGFNVIDPSQWPSTGSSSNVDITNGTDTIVMRIDYDTDIDGSAIPSGTFDVIGLGSQYDFSSPYNDGYQILPRGLDDLSFQAIATGNVGTTIFSENFDGVTTSDSIGKNYNTDSSNVGSGRGWSLDSNFQSTGNNSYHTQNYTNDSIIFETIAFSTVGYSQLYLTFDHICKIRYTQKAFVQISRDNGQNWVNLNVSDYLGESPQFGFIGWFNELSYPSALLSPYWLGPTIGNSNTGNNPTNNWWAQESFDLSSYFGEYDIQNSQYGFTQCKIRFIMTNKAGTPSPASLSGWYVDNIRVTDSIISSGTNTPSYDLTINIDLNDILSSNTLTNVTLAGPLNNWSGTDTLNDTDGDGVYTLMLADIDSGNFEYKIRWHDSSGNTNWEPGANKIVSVSSDSILPVRCFGNDSYGACVTSSTSNHSMSLQACTGDVISYEFDITSAFDSTNTFRVEISNFTTNYSTSSPVFSDNFIEVNALSAYQVDTNYQIVLHIPDSLLQGVYSIRLVSSSPSTVDGTIGNIIIGESPTPVLASVYKNATQSLFSSDTLSICPSDSALILAQSIQDGTGSWIPSWQWYKNGLPISGQVNDTLLVQGSINTDTYWVEESASLCDAISDTFYLREDAYSGSLTVSSQYYNPPNALTAIADGGDEYYWHSDKPVYIDDVHNDTIQVGLMSDSTTLYVDANFGNSCLHQNSILLYDTTLMVCDVFDTIPVFDTIAVYDTTHIDVYDTLFVTNIDTVTLTVTDTLIIDVSLVGLNPLSFEYQVKVYPNPTRDYILIDVPTDMISQSYFIELANPLGQIVYYNLMNQSQLQINISSLGATGTYVLKLYDSSLNLVDKRIIILQ